MGECLRCGESRYKIKEDDEGVRKKETPAKVIWYLPIIPRFRRLSDENNDKLLRWHADERKKDGCLYIRPILCNGETSTKSFSILVIKELRNLRLGLCTDEMNPFGTLGTQHSRGDHGPGSGQNNLPIGRAGPGLNSGRIFVSKACYFRPKLAGFCGPKRVGTKNRLKSRF